MTRTDDDYPTLFDPDDPLAGKVGRDHPYTSRLSAELGKVGFGSERARVLLAVVGAGGRGATAAEVAERTASSSRNQVAARLLELREGGWLIYLEDGFGERVVRQTDGGHRALVHVLNPDARGAFDSWLARWTESQAS